MDPRDKGMLRAASILGIISLLPVVIVLVLLGPYSVTTMIEESRWKPQDSSHLDVVNTSIGNSGMLFDIYAPAGVAAIYRRGGSPLPWGPQHDRVQFWSVIGDNPGQIKVLVKRSFDSEDEYFFGINSRDGYWTTVSGKWKKPDLSDAKWNELRSEAER